jgi:hypothetical protein
VVHHVLRSKDRRATVYHRIILTMSVHDWLVAALNFVGTWTKEYMWLAAGNQQTCTASGFLRQGSLLTSVLYSACLTLFFLLVVKYGWRERRISQFVEPAMHACCLMIGWGTAIAGLLMNLYASYPWGCGIVADPPGCTQSYKATPENPANCVRGDNAGIYSWVFLTGWSWATFLFIFVAMVIIYRSVRARETKNDQYDFGRKIGSQSDEKGKSAVGSLGGAAAASASIELRSKKKPNTFPRVCQSGISLLSLFLCHFYIRINQHFVSQLGARKTLCLS